MAKRTSKTVVANVTRERYEESLSSYAVADAKEQKINASMDEAMTKIREKYATELTSLAEEKESAFEVVQAYATENQSILFTKKKSIETTHGVIGFRTGTPKLKLKKGFQWTAVLELLKGKKSAYIRKIEEVDKEKFLIDRELPKTKDLMSAVGIEVAQDEKFFIELKKEEAAA